MNVTLIPYFMTGMDKMRKFPASEAASMLDAKMADKGVKNLGWMVDANDGIFTSAKAPLVKPEDFKGVKIRGLSKLFDAGLIAMGAAPSAMPGSEVYQALQTGVIDAGITGVAAAFARKYYEVQKFGVASNIILAYDKLIVNPEWFGKLPADLRKAIEEAAAQGREALDPDKRRHPARGHQGAARQGHERDRARRRRRRRPWPTAMQPAVIKDFLAASPDAAKLVELVNKL